MTVAFWIIATAMLAALMAAMLAPLLRGGGGLRGSEADEQYRRQLTELMSREPGGPEKAATRTEIARRLAEASQRSGLVARPLSDGARSGLAAGLAALVPVAAITLYLAFGSPALIGPASGGSGTAHADRAPSTGEAAVAAERLAARLAREPGDVDGWVLLAQTYLSLGRPADALGAFDKAVALEPSDLILLALRGEARVNAADGVVTPAAREDFLKVGKADPRARFYLAMGMAQDGRNAEAVTALRDLLGEAPADAPWRGIVQQRIAELGAQLPPQLPPLSLAPLPPANPAPAAGPSAADMAAAATMSPDDRAAMIRGMVSRLAERLAANPDDADGWMRLIRSWGVIGDREKMADAVRSALAAIREPQARAAIAGLAREQGVPVGDAPLPVVASSTSETPQDASALADKALRDPASAELLEDYAAAVMGENSRVPAALVDVTRKILVVNPDNQAALWYAGLQASQSGNPIRAAQHWSRLLAMLPPDSAASQMLKARIDGLR